MNLQWRPRGCDEVLGRDVRVCHKSFVHGFARQGKATTKTGSTARECAAGVMRSRSWDARRGVLVLQ